VEQEASRNESFEVRCFAFDFSRTDFTPRDEQMKIVSAVKGREHAEGATALAAE